MQEVEKQLKISNFAHGYDIIAGKKVSDFMSVKHRSNKNNTFQKVYEIVRQIPKGNVATYGQVAALIGDPRMAQVVGFALHVNPEPGAIPCHRVVNRFGKLAEAFAFGGADEHRRLLAEEGVTFTPEGNVDLERHLWRVTRVTYEENAVTAGVCTIRKTKGELA